MENIQEQYEMVTNCKLQLVREKTEIYSTKVKNLDDSSKFLRKLYDENTIGLYEEFYILLLNNALSIIGYSKVSQGGFSSTVVDLKIIFSTILKTTMCSGIVLSHNHPSGQLKPSQHDINLTKKINEAAALFDIVLYDHIIMTEDSHYSMVENNDF